jgi:hypothetical protein
VPDARTLVAITTAIATTRPSTHSVMKVASSQTYRYGPSSRRVRKRSTRASSSWQSRLTWLLEMPVIPSAWTRVSTRRVETPCTYASWITATSARSARVRGSNRVGK